MACGSCQKNKQNQNTEPPRIIINQVNIPMQQAKDKIQPASPKFQVPKVLPPLK